MTQDPEKLIDRLTLPERHIITRDDKLVRIKEIVYFYGESGKAYAVTESGNKYNIVQNLQSLQKEFEGYFLQVHRSFLVPLDRITAIYNRFPEEPGEDGETTRRAVGRDRDVEEECEIILEGSEKRIPVTQKYSGVLKDYFRLKTLHHVVPEHPDDRKLRLLGLIDFGWRELLDLDPKNAPAVDAFKKKWDIRQFTRERMLTYFRQILVNRIDKRRVIKNIIYQLLRWMKKGIEKLSDGNIRSLWYKIKATLAYHSNILEPGDVDIYYSALQEMIEEQKLFRYKDFGFMDMSEPYRGIGKTRPEIILASEKAGHFFFIRDLAKEVGTSFVCMRGEPSVISLEYFSDDLFTACGDAEKVIFCISDIDPAGYSIERNLVEGLTSRGHKVRQVTKLVDPSLFPGGDIVYALYPVVRYQQKGEVIKPMKPATVGQVTKALDWWNAYIKDERFITEKQLGNGWKTVTISGIESDSADREVVRKRFLDGLSGLSPRVRRKTGR